MNHLELSVGRGIYAASENHALINYRGAKRDGSRYGVIYCHSHNNDIGEALVPGYVEPLLSRLAELGVLVVAATLGGASAWGNSTAKARVADAATFLAAQGAKSGKVGLVGFSMGGPTACNYMRQDTSKVAGALLIDPAVNMNRLHDSDISGGQAEIEAAYGGAAAWTAAKAASDPQTNAAAHAGPPMHCYWDTGDTIITDADVTNFVAGVGATATKTNKTSGFGHDPRSVPTSEADWLAGLL